MILEVEEYLSGNFNMKDLGEADMIFRMKESKTPRDITLSLSHSIEKMLKKFTIMIVRLSGPYDTSISLGKIQMIMYVNTNIHK